MLSQEIDLPGLSGFRNLDISVIGLDVVFKSVLTVYEQDSVINWSIPALGGNGVFQGMLVGPDFQTEVNGPCTTSRKS
ncbi:MAG TPA: hypothetical protein PLL78_04935 [Fimbriimonadaceae bacterium]|nr:hypothetical protein [Fimbriimonadaceae bacterium]HRJ96009.1 hypothetical protein [Fimbriimonadaceae bacterium]